MKFWVENKCFWRTFKLILMHFIHEIIWFECFLHKIYAIFQKIQFSRISNDQVWFLINWKFLDFSSLASTWLDWYLIDARPIEIEKFSVSKILTNFFYASFMFKDSHALHFFFLYPSCSFAVISLIVFTHNMHTLFYIGYSTWFKNWFINFWVLYTF